MTRVFSEQQQRAYDLYRDHPPKGEGPLAMAYRRGFQHPTKQEYAPSTLAFAAWAAGVDAAGATGIERAITKAGGGTKLAKHLGVSRQRVANWKTQGWVPKDYVVEIEAEFGIPRRELMDPKLVDLLSGAME